MPDELMRIIGLPGDRTQVIDGAVYINGAPIQREPVADFVGERPCGGTVGDAARMRVARWSETLPNGSSDDTLHGTMFDCFPDTISTLFQ